MATIRIISVPPSRIRERPDFAGEGWIGLELKLLPHQNAQQKVFDVDGWEALEKLAVKSPEAARWWEGWPDANGPGRHPTFSFASTCCEYIP